MEWLEFLLQHYLKLPQRVVLSLFGFFAIVNAYTMRLCLDQALMYIVPAPPASPKGAAASAATPKRYALTQRWQRASNITLLPLLASRNATRADCACERVSPAAAAANDWSPQWQTFILTSFYVGYVISHVPGGQLAERYGGKWVLAVGIVSAAVLTLLTPLAIRVGGPVALICLRVLLGLSEGPIFPALCTLLTQWVPAQERGKLGVLVLSAGQLGIFLVNFVSTLVLHSFQWSLLFYFFGCCALFWFVCFIVLCYNDPASSPFIQETEKQYLQAQISSTHSQLAPAPTPWKHIFKSAPMWALIWASVQYDWTQAQSSAARLDTAHYASDAALGENLQTSISATLPNVLSWLVSLASGVLSDYLINHNILSTTVTRKLMTGIAAWGPNFFVSMRSCFACSERKDVAALLNCAMAVMGTYYAGIMLTPLDMSPNYAGTLMGIANGVGSLTALVVPFLEEHALKRFFQPPFNELRALIWLACTALITGEIQEFNDPVASVDKIM